MEITNEEQMKRWIAGESIHRKNGGYKNQGECTPDFSCCYPSLLASDPERIRFSMADGKERERMLFEFLGKLIDLHFKNEKIYLTK